VAAVVKGHRLQEFFVVVPSQLALGLLSVRSRVVVLGMPVPLSMFLLSPMGMLVALASLQLVVHFHLLIFW
jgi:hypothetical protein